MAGITLQQAQDYSDDIIAALKIEIQGLYVFIFVSHCFPLFHAHGTNSRGEIYRALTNAETRHALSLLPAFFRASDTFVRNICYN